MKESDEERGVVIVTGARRGIGAAIAKLLAVRGYPVAVNFAQDRSAAERTVGEIISAGGRAVAMRGDVSHEKEVVELFATCERELGTIGGLVNNAGVTGGFARVEELRAEAIAEVLAVNVTGAI